MKKLDKEEILVDIKNIKTHETYTLPSKGLVYKPEDKIPASITLRRMTTKEDKMRLRNESEDKIRKEILQSCIMEDIDVGKLKLMDVNFLLFRLRSLSLLTDTYKVACMCNMCRTEFIHEINLLDVPVKYMSEDNINKLHITLPVSRAKIDLKYPTLDDFIKMGDDLRNYTKNFPNANINEYLYTQSGTLYVDAVNGNYLMNEELETYFDNLDILDSRELRLAINELDKEFGFEDNLIAKCPSCKAKVVHGLPITNELFTPSK